ncbi:hypothetical protein ACSYDW_13735 [Paeniglutamicibacter sp. R2-26]|uniref:hypothetical protein n=1 Tax=Paeniglutamicibacter sp. R2-26 TaxID=3144417 RepID=UPI003EE4B1E0
MSPGSGRYRHAIIDGSVSTRTGGASAPRDTRFMAAGDQRCARGTGSSSIPD